MDQNLEWGYSVEIVMLYGALVLRCNVCKDILKIERMTIVTV